MVRDSNLIQLIPQAREIAPIPSHESKTERSVQIGRRKRVTGCHCFFFPPLAYR